MTDGILRDLHRTQFQRFLIVPTMLKFFTLIMIGLGFAVLGKAGVDLPSTGGQTSVAGTITGPVVADQRLPVRER